MTAVWRHGYATGDDYDTALAAVVDRPGSRVSELPGANAAILRYLRVGGRVTAEGNSPKRWYPTLPAGAE